MGQGFGGPGSYLPPALAKYVESLTWQDLDVGDADASVNQATIDTVSTTDGVWEVILDQSASYVDRPYWAFNVTVEEGYVILFRLIPVAHPTAAQDIEVGIGHDDSVTPIVVVAGGYQYPTGTTDLKAWVTLDSFGPVSASVAYARADVDEVKGLLLDNAAKSQAYDSGSVAVSKDLADATLGGGGDRLAVCVYNAGPSQETIQFRPQYLKIELSELLSVY